MGKSSISMGHFSSSPWFFAKKPWPIEIDGLPFLIAWWIFPWQTVNVITRWYVQWIHGFQWISSSPTDLDSIKKEHATWHVMFILSMTIKIMKIAHSQQRKHHHVHHFPEKKNIPSGELTVCYGKSPFLMGKSTINGPFSIANC